MACSMAADPFDALTFSTFGGKKLVSHWFQYITCELSSGLDLTLSLVEILPLLSGSGWLTDTLPLGHGSSLGRGVCDELFSSWTFLVLLVSPMSLTVFSWNLTGSRTLVLIRLVVIDPCWTSGVLFVRALFVGAIFVV